MLIACAAITEQNCFTDIHVSSDTHTSIASARARSKSILGLIGSVLILVGLFAPSRGDSSYFEINWVDASFILILGLLSLVFLTKDRDTGLWFTGFGCLTVAAHIEQRASDWTSQLQVGWVLLLVGALFVIASAAISKPEIYHRRDGTVDDGNLCSQYSTSNTKEILGFLGSLLLFIGLFTPIIENASYFQTFKRDARFILALAVVSLVLVIRRRYRDLVYPGIGSLAVMALTYIAYIRKAQRISDWAVLVANPNWGALLALTGSLILIYTPTNKKTSGANSLYTAAAKPDANATTPGSDKNDKNSVSREHSFLLKTTVCILFCYLCTYLWAFALEEQKGVPEYSFTWWLWGIVVLATSIFALVGFIVHLVISALIGLVHLFF
jgi:hypothetical protein